MSHTPGEWIAKEGMIYASTDMSQRIDIICAHCRSRDVRRDATAAWNRDTQQWELSGVQDQGYCDDCGGEARLEEIPMSLVGATP